jgi:phosphoribosylglycinamide formyltransferase-1
MIYNTNTHNGRMNIICFISGSGTNYQRIVERDPNHNYVVFTNRPGCEGAEKARSNKHVTIELSHLPYLKAARTRYGSMSVPRNCPEREKYEQDAWNLIEGKFQKAPDLICLAGYDQWLTDWTVEKYYPKILNIHPGNTTKGYAGLYWIPTAKAILSGDSELRSTVFLVDRGEDTGPVLAQSAPLRITPTLRALESEGIMGLVEGFNKVMLFAKNHGITTYDAFENSAGTEQKEIMKQLCENLQMALKVSGDWQIYPFAVHDLIASGRVEVSDRTIFIDNRQMPDHGYRADSQVPF